MKDLALPVLLLLASSCVGSPQVVLTNEDQSHQLTYDCADDIKPQVETPEDIRVLLSYLPAVLKALAADRKLVSLDSLRKANRDIRTMEAIVVRELCEQRAKDR